MKFTYEDLELSAEVSQDLMEFGPNLEVIAIYSTFPEVPNVNFVTDYLWGEPNIEDYWVDLDEYEKAIDDYTESLKLLEGRKCKHMTLYELAKIIQRQAEIF